MVELIRYMKKKLMRVCLTPLKLFPLAKNRVLLVNGLSRKFAGNPKAVCNALQQYYPGQFERIVAVSDPDRYTALRAEGIKIVRFNSLKYFYSAMTSKIFLSNSGGYSYLPLRKKQYVINTWHGGGAYKKCGQDSYSRSKFFQKDLLLQSRQTNLFLSTCTKFTEVISAAMLIPQSNFWEIGMPRNDMLLHQDEKQRTAIREKLGLKEEEKLILFAPTYRKIDDNYFKDSIAISYGVDVQRVCAAMQQRFGGTWRFAMRYHPCVTNRSDMVSMGDVMDLTDYEDMQELLLAADAMINDFSSSMWDFVLTGRPSFLFAVDLDHYVATTDVYTPVEEWPFPKSTNNDELERNILEFDENAYAAACQRHYEDLGGCESGKATELVCQRIYEVCKRN